MVVSESEFNYHNQGKSQGKTSIKQVQEFKRKDDKLILKAEKLFRARKTFGIVEGHNHLHPERDYYKKERRLEEFYIYRTVKGIES